MKLVPMRFKGVQWHHNPKELVFECDKTVKELNFRVKYNLAVLATKKDGEVKPVITGERRFEKDEHLLVLGKEEDVRKVTK